MQNWPKRRIHFHAFMQDVHGQRQRLGGEDVINRIADEWAANARLLCLDEMQIVDIADAMIIGRLYEALHARGVVLVTTSNLPPEGLYKDGLNRDLFLPFIVRPARDTRRGVAGVADPITASAASRRGKPSSIPRPPRTACASTRCGRT